MRSRSMPPKVQTDQLVPPTKTGQRLGLYEKKYAYFYILPGVFVLALITLAPFIYDVILSFTNKSLASAKPPAFIGFANYKDVVMSKYFWIAVWKTLHYSVVAVVIEMVLGFILALLFQVEFRGKIIIRSLLLLPMVATPIAISFLWKIMYNPNSGVINYFLNLLHLPDIAWLGSEKTAMLSVILVDVWQWTPFVFIIISAGLASLPEEPFEAAVVDGASLGQMLWHIMLPLLKPILIIALLFRVVDSFKAFDLIYVLTGGGPGISTETLNIHVFLNGFKYLNMGYAAALSIFLIVFIILISSFIVKRGGFGL
ncbi:ABC transporter permease subunit [candidate division KSB3 bacterium]|uniref:ABC transporter permease subunit n=1 Tax=candidate division KSB3 bacterium TaxID=2044937 RepID=A0A9D5Q580_9BACT|nr:ABC transporter permease subunit [candidate division KSB3 bacterium]MBD3324315.1 ABC transporter permease subunit [candidate division KSB3 bacterium]